MKIITRNGQLLAFETSWRDYSFSDEDIRKLRDGQEISFEIGAPNGERFPCSGAYQEREMDGIHVMKFVPKSHILAEIPTEKGLRFVPLYIGKYGQPTEEELRQLLAGKIVQIRYQTKTAERKAVCIRWYESHGSVWLKLVKYDGKQWKEIQEEGAELLCRLEEQAEQLRHECTDRWTLHLSPSMVASFFDYDCDRFLAARALRKQSAGKPSSARKEQDSFSSQAGNLWEQKSLQYLSRQYDVIEFFGEDRCGLVDAFISPIEGGKKARFIYQAEFRVRDPLPGNRTPNPDRSPAEPRWGAIKPDLLLVEEEEDGTRRISVIDVKLAKHPHMTHKMQVGLYSLLLEQFMREYCADTETGWTCGEGCFISPQGIRVYLDPDSGYLWNGTHPLKEVVHGAKALESLEELKDYWNPVPYSEVMPFLRDFLDNRVDALIGEIGRILEKGSGRAGKDEILKALPFCIGSNCEQCAKCRDCIEWGKAADSVQLYPGLSRPAQKYIQALAKEHGEDILSVGTLRRKLTGKEQEDQLLWEQLQSNFTWKRLTFPGNFNKLADMMETRKDIQGIWEPKEALLDIPKGQGKAQKQSPIDKARDDRVASMQIPRTQDAAVIMTVQRGLTAEGDTICYAYGIHLRLKEKAFGVFRDAQGRLIEKEGSFIRAADRLCPEQDLGEAFIDDLYQIIQDANAHNQKAADPITLQGYVFDQSEFESIQSLLYEKLSDPWGEETNKKIFAILFWMQGDRIVGALEEHPSEVLDFPVTVLSKEICKLYEVPAYVTVQLWNVAKLFRAGDLREEFPGYSGLLSDNVCTEAVYDAEGGNKREGTNLGGYLEKRLAMEAEILLAVQKKAARSLFHELVAFALPAASAVQDPRLSKLLFQSLNESALNRRRYHSTLMLDPARVIANKDCIRVEFDHPEPIKESRGYYRAICTAVQLHRAGQKKMNKAYLIPLDQDGKPHRKKLEEVRRESQAADDEELCDAMNVDYREVKTEGGLPLVTFRVPAGLELKKGTRYILLEKPTSNQYEKEIKALETIGNRRGCDVQKLLYPEEYYKNPRREKHPLIPGSSGEALLSYGKIGETTFAEGQEEAFCHVCDHRITLLQGPPGTGKTDFIARTVTALIRANQAKGTKGRPLRILVSAFTHAAINNALKKICDKAAEAGLSMLAEGAEANSGFDLAVYKDKSSREKKFQIEDLKTIIQLSSDYSGPSEKDGLKQKRNGKGLPWETVLKEVPSPGAVVVGATCWACRSANPFFDPLSREAAQAHFDLVIIDEASQMPVAQALMTMAYGRADSTHYLIVGDHHQLPPIIQGRYVPTPKELDLHHSIFRFYLDASKNSPCELECDHRLALRKNFRMNEALCNYSAEKIYTGIGYCGASEKIRTQKLTLADNWRETLAEAAWAEQILDPEYPMVVVYLSGAAAGKMGRLEIQMVSKLTMLLMQNLVGKNGKPYVDVHGEGWEESMYSFWGTSPKQKKEGFEQTGPAFGILSPYHKQIDALKKQITGDVEKAYGAKLNSDALLIDTVDKLQGQEREAVIVSYGVNDVEEAVAQGEFIYNYQRLNVSLTRGKKKTILFLTGALADRPIEMLNSNDPELLNGVAFLCGLKDYMRKPQSGFEGDISGPFTLEGIQVEVFRKKYTGQ